MSKLSPKGREKIHRRIEKLKKDYPELKKTNPKKQLKDSSEIPHSKLVGNYRPSQEFQDKVYRIMKQMEREQGGTKEAKSNKD